MGFSERHVYALVRFDYPVDSENPENSAWAFMCRASGAFFCPIPHILRPE